MPIVYDTDEDFGTLPVAETVQNASCVNNPLLGARVDTTKLSHMNSEEKQQFLSLLDQFPDVFDDKPGLCTVGEHAINVTPDFKPKRLKAYKVPELLKPEVARQLQELLDLGFICRSNSEMASPIACVLKGHSGENGVHICCDYRYLNKYTNGDAYPTQLKVKPEHRWLTAFVTDFGTFEWIRMLFG